MKTKKCPMCNQIKPRKAFSDSARNKDGKQCYCKACQAGYQREHPVEDRLKYRKKYVEHTNAYIMERKQRMRKRIDALKRRRCCKACGVSGSIKRLEFHHLDPNEKDYSISKMVSMSIRYINKEVKKCVLLCRRCHKKAHQEMIQND